MNFTWRTETKCYQPHVPRARIKCAARLLPGSCASATLTFGQDVVHPFPGKAYIFISYLLSELSRHQTNNFFMILLEDSMHTKINKTVLAIPIHNNAIFAQNVCF